VWDESVGVLHFRKSLGHRAKQGQSDPELLFFFLFSFCQFLVFSESLKNPDSAEGKERQGKRMRYFNADVSVMVQHTFPFKSFRSILFSGRTLPGQADMLKVLL